MKAHKSIDPRNIFSPVCSLCNFLSDVDTVFEPVAQWQNFSGTDFLKLFFDDPKRWSGTFTSVASLTR